MGEKNENVEIKKKISRWEKYYLFITGGPGHLWERKVQKLSLALLNSPPPFSSSPVFCFLEFGRCFPIRKSHMLREF